MSTQRVGAVTGSAALIYIATVHVGLDHALNNPMAKGAWMGGAAGPIAMYQNVSDQIANLPGVMGKTIPGEVVFPFSPPTATMELIAPGGGRALHPLVQESLKVTINRYGCGYYVERQDFFKDVYGILRRVPQKLARPVIKIADQLLAAVLRTGKVTLDHTNTNFFATGKPVSLAGATTDVYNNLYTGAPCTAASVQRLWTGMRSIKNQDRLSLDIRPDTLIVPPDQEFNANQATQIEYQVYSQTGNPFNTGQPANTASMGQNWIATSKAIKQIVVLPELTIGGAAIDTTSWYMSECGNANHGQSPGLCLAEDPMVEFFTQMGMQDSEVWNNDRFAWAIQKWIGAGPGLGQFIARADA